MSLFGRIFKRGSASSTLDRFDKFLTSLTIDGTQVLFVLLADDGTVNRLGDGSEGCIDRDMFIGRSDGGLFARFMSAVDPGIFAHQGAYDVKEKVGKICELRVLFGLRGSDSSEGFQFRYGSESEGPPREIRQLVIKAVEITDPWHRNQKTISEKR